MASHFVPVTSLAFHPLRSHMAAGSLDSSITVYSVSALYAHTLLWNIARLYFINVWRHYWRFVCFPNVLKMESSLEGYSLEVGEAVRFLLFKEDFIFMNVMKFWYITLNLSRIAKGWFGNTHLLQGTFNWEEKFKSRPKAGGVVLNIFGILMVQFCYSILMIYPKILNRLFLMVLVLSFNSL